MDELKQTMRRQKPLPLNSRSGLHCCPESETPKNARYPWSDASAFATIVLLAY
jgi:hypothetical protein